MDEDILKTPAAFRRIWFHTTEVKSEICSTGWNPEKIKCSMYGSAVYLARKKWDLDAPLSDLLGPIGWETLVKGLRSPKMIACVLALETDAVMSCFPSERAPDGNTESDLLNYLNKNVPQDKAVLRSGIQRIETNGLLTSLRFGRNPVSGDNKKNKEIARYFLTNGIKAIRFFEHSEEVVAVFDPDCIRILPKSTNFEVYPFSNILGANDMGALL